uniref:Uncharacterized protein n=1 Tax=Bos mutus grunniens TaxID=30521 RepID=A0A8C0ABM1_BOSMU
NLPETSVWPSDTLNLTARRVGWPEGSPTPRAVENKIGPGKIQASSEPGARPPGQPHPDSPAPRHRRRDPSAWQGRRSPGQVGRPGRGRCAAASGSSSGRCAARPVVAAARPRGWRRPRSASRWPRGPGGAASSRAPPPAGAVSAPTRLAPCRRRRRRRRPRPSRRVPGAALAAAAAASGAVPRPARGERPGRRQPGPPSRPQLAPQRKVRLRRRLARQPGMSRGRGRAERRPGGQLRPGERLLPAPPAAAPGGLEWFFLACASPADPRDGPWSPRSRCRVTRASAAAAASAAAPLSLRPAAPAAAPALPARRTMEFSERKRSRKSQSFKLVNRDYHHEVYKISDFSSDVNGEAKETQPIFR